MILPLRCCSRQRGGVAARSAYEMHVRVVGKVVYRRAVTEMDMNEHTQVLEMFKDAVDGAYRNVGVNLPDPRREVFRSRVISSGEQCVEHRPAGSRYPSPGVSEGLKDYR